MVITKQSIDKTKHHNNTTMSEVTYRKQYNNITLKSLTAYQLMLYRESMLELFGALDNADRDSSIVSEERLQKNKSEIDELLAVFKK